MVDYVECIDWVTTLTITPKPGAGGSSPSTPANLGHTVFLKKRKVKGAVIVQGKRH